MQSPSLRVRRGSSSFNPRKTIVMAGLVPAIHVFFVAET
jgi:hypothetical protein